MIVCHCRGVTDREIRSAIREGACTRRQVGRACSASVTCGGCGPVVDAILDSELAASHADTASPAVAAG